VARPPKRFDAIVEEKLYTPPRTLAPSDYARPGGNIRMRGPVEGSGKSIAQLCAEGALEAYRCGGGSGADGRVGVAFSAPGGAGSVNGSGSLAFAGPRSGIDAAPLPPISVPVTALLSGSGGSFRLADVFRVTPRPGPVAGNGNARLLFPLIGSAVTSSGFGWRLHPILGSWLMHAGRDLAAPEGTPVVAALSGRVVSSGLAGGYGLAVEVEHDRPRRRTLYGHLSELYVKEGEMVRQGEVIGRVGSTGLSTGPHLHFELRQPSDGGWVAVDPGEFDAAGTLLADGGRPGAAGPSDAVALLMAQLVQTLERPAPAAAPRG
jgi:murein DD-endopeptidase MepM/ murein hydrolase activator NlpD